ncbi:hypothetical protein [Enterobacter sp. RHBSTW-00994]|uniref:hypothetical protein n=1 Tax=Enterobacter sp. RHBSTW-00994 TaxID=2742676 RepID=UPI002017D79E|nr:hypothetical protein [Enterobacter sp. RHBSTW-00994]
MYWSDIVSELERHAQSYDRSTLPNALFILSKGFFIYGDEHFGSTYNSDIINPNNITVYGNPDYQGCCLYQLYDIIFSLLSDTKIQKAFPHQYYRLPLTAGEYSYEYSLGQFAEYGHCEKHGDYARSFTPETLEKIINWCKTAEPINWIKATDIAYGITSDNVEAYKRQPGDVRIYNPENLPLSEILVTDRTMTYEGKEIFNKVLAFDSIKSCGMTIYIPYYYQFTENLVQTCPKCEKVKIQKK